MQHRRSPTLLAVFGGIALAVALGVWLIAGENWIMWLCLLLASALLGECYFWKRSMSVAAIYYNRTADHIEHAAYNFRGALLRCVLLFGLLAVAPVLGRKGFHVLPDGGRLFFTLFGPVAAYVLLVALAYRSDVVGAAKRNKWRLRPRRKR